MNEFSVELVSVVDYESDVVIFDIIMVVSGFHFKHSPGFEIEKTL